LFSAIAEAGLVSIEGDRFSDEGDEMSSKPIKVALVSSVGGHLTELLALKGAYESHDHFYVFNDETQFTPPEGITEYRVSHAERDWLVLKNVWEFYKIFRKEKPTVMLSTGAGPAVPAALVAKLFGMRVVYVESVAAVKQPTLTGELIYPFSDSFFVQWPGLKNNFEGSKCAGNIFGSL